MLAYGPAGTLRKLLRAAPVPRSSPGARAVRLLPYAGGSGTAALRALRRDGARQQQAKVRAAEGQLIPSEQTVFRSWTSVGKVCCQFVYSRLATHDRECLDLVANSSEVAAFERSLSW